MSQLLNITCEAGQPAIFSLLLTSPLLLDVLNSFDELAGVDKYE